MPHTRASLTTAITLALITSLGSLHATAQDSAASETRAAAPAPNPAAEQAVRTHAQNVLAAINGKGATPGPQQFTEDFNAQVPTEQLNSVFSNVRSSVGNCQIAAQMRAPVSHVAGYLLACDKAFIPIELMVEEKAPYRIQGLLIRPSFWKS